MSQLENEILRHVMYLDGDQKTKVLDYLRSLRGVHSQKQRRRSALRQIRKALEQA